MIKMAQFEDIRKMYFMEELSIREISRRTGHHRDTIAKYLELEIPEPPKYNLTQERHHRILGSFIPIIHEILKSDESKPRKQKHTSRRIFERLIDEYGYTGGYSTITQYLRKTKKKKKEAFLPLEFQLGAHAEVDWGEAKFLLNGKETTAYLFVMKLGASRGFYVRAYPFQKQEAFFDGHRKCFDFMGGVPYEIAYDNLKSAVKNILKGHEREEQEQFISLRTHYLYNANFCKPAKGSEKGGVESAVKYIQQNYFVPYPDVSSFEELNEHLLKCCMKDLDKNPKWEAEKKALRPLPSVQFPCVKYTEARVNTYSLVTFDTNKYSVPTKYVSDKVTIKSSVDEIEIYLSNTCIARHPRFYGKNTEHIILDHYLELMLQKPRAIGNTKVYNPTTLPPVYEQYRRLLVARSPKGNQEFVRVLMLHREYPIDQVSTALELAMEYRVYNYDVVHNLLLQLNSSSPKVIPLRQENISHIPRVTVEPPKLDKYNFLLNGGDKV
jgi:transposase